MINRVRRQPEATPARTLQQTSESEGQQIAAARAQIQIILDWYHLHKKCEQPLSLGLAGRAVRNQVLDELMKLLWYGLVDRAIAYLKNGEAERWLKKGRIRFKLVA